MHEAVQNLLTLPLGKGAPAEVNAIIEIPCGSRNKFEYDEECGLFRLDRVLHSPMHYPGDYGFIPRTLCDDGDSLDVLVLVSQPTFTGCLLTVRPIGYLRMIDEGESDEKILAVPCGDPEYHEITDYTKIAAHRLRLIKHFFESYGHLEGKRTSTEGWGGLEEAKSVILRSNKRYESLSKNSRHKGITSEFGKPGPLSALSA
ncbi:MAG TPA: inorganic diphosphatase [Candidatus Baltobacteraceae bacterium]|jgi:inorganic pyrophosphatase|nr:inorganic diphosphatase [Candidatus Baltobacteraceae bacterium]